MDNAFIRPPYLAFAPLQGYTDCVYRQAHCEAAGRVDEYYTPFVRLEDGEPRRKDLRDIDAERNHGVPTVPQVIARDREEFARLCDAVQTAGFRRVDLNMGCPFPMQVKAGRGSGLLADVERVAAIGEEMRQRREVRFSVKMRLGQEEEEECLRLVPILNEMPWEHVTMHPRLGKQQYKGVPDREAFGRFVEACRQPVVYNGDLLSAEDVSAVMRRWPTLKGVMMGRGLLARPWMLSGREPLAVVREMHARIFDYAVSALQGDSQILARLHAFWEYQTDLLDKKQYKAIMKSRSLRKYRAAITALGWC